MYQVTEGMKLNHRFGNGSGYGMVEIIDARNAYQGMVTVVTADGRELSALLQDMPDAPFSEVIW